MSPAILLASIAGAQKKKMPKVATTDNPHEHWLITVPIRHSKNVFIKIY